VKIAVVSETENDYEFIRKVNDLAFGQTNEGELIDALIAN
jgi:predicted N-acetyltransferase YhbS